MVNREDVFKEVKAILVDKLRVDESYCKEESSIMEGLGLDDLDYIELIMQIEYDFNVVLPDEEVYNSQFKQPAFSNLGDFVTYLHNAINKAGNVFSKGGFNAG